MFEKELARIKAERSGKKPLKRKKKKKDKTKAKIKKEEILAKRRKDIEETEQEEVSLVREKIEEPSEEPSEDLPEKQEDFLSFFKRDPRKVGKQQKEEKITVSEEPQDLEVKEEAPELPPKEPSEEITDVQEEPQKEEKIIVSEEPQDLEVKEEAPELPPKEPSEETTDVQEEPQKEEKIEISEKPQDLQPKDEIKAKIKYKEILEKKILEIEEVEQEKETEPPLTVETVKEEESLEKKKLEIEEIKEENNLIKKKVIKMAEQQVSSNKRKNAEEILKKLSEKYEKEGKDVDSFEKFLQHRKPKKLKIRARIPVTISPDVKRSLRQRITPDEKAKVNLIVDFKEPKARKGRIIISEQKRKDKKRILTLQAPEIPSSFSSSASIFRESPNKDILLEKLKRKRTIKKRRMSRK